MDLRYHYQPAPGYTHLIQPGSQPIHDLDFGMLSLARGETYETNSGSYELGLVILGGVCTAQVDDETFAMLGERETVFDGRASGVYAPCQAHLTVTCESERLEIAVCRCPTEIQSAAQAIRPADIVAREVGGPGFLRYVHDIFGAQTQASVMLVGETFTVEGNWSSFPPHKHDVEALPEEVRQEELYLYKIRPENGFGLQYLYTNADSPHGALDQALAVHNNDVTLMPFGYHPVAAPPGYDVYYLWFLAGKSRLMRPHDDPAHAWIKEPRARTRTYPT